MRTKAAFVAPLLSLIAHAASAETNIRQAIENRENRSFLLDTVRAQADGIQWSNSYLNVIRKERPLYCAPSKLGITAEQHLDIVERYIEKHPDNGNRPLNQLGMVLLYSLIETFPCND